MHIESIFAVLIIGFFVVITPGPNMAVVIKNTLSGNFFSGLLTAFGLLVGNLIHITYCLIGIGLIISKSILLFNIIKILGAIYLIYLGIKILISKALNNHENPELKIQKKTYFHHFLNGFFTDLLNPKATLFFLALFTQIIKPEYSLLEKIFTGSSVAVLEFVCFSILSFIIGSRIIKRLLKKGIHVIEKVTGVLFILLGIRIIFTGNSK